MKITDKKFLKKKKNTESAVSAKEAAEQAEVSSAAPETKASTEAKDSTEYSESEAAEKAEEPSEYPRRKVEKKSGKLSKKILSASAGKKDKSAKELTSDPEEAAAKAISGDALSGSSKTSSETTEKAEKRRISISITVWNRMLLIVIIIILSLTLLIVFLQYKKDREMDMSFPASELTSSTDSLLSGFQLMTAEPYSANLVVSSGIVPCDGVQMQNSQEKALLFNIYDKKAVFAQGIYDQVYPASLTKIMTALLVMENANMDDTVVMEDSDFQMEEGSQVSGLQTGDVVTVGKLFRTLLIYSGNDAALALARVVGGSTENFVAMMNQRAQELGMTGTHFCNPHGLHESDHYTTAYDVYLMLNAAIQYTEFTDVIQMDSYQLEGQHADGSEFVLWLESTDQYLSGIRTVPQDVHLIGGKTGTTDEAGSCLALYSQNKYGIPHISVILNADSKDALYTDMNQLLSAENTSAS